MAQTKAARAAESLNGAAAKVLAVVPLSEPWPLSAICSELYRQGSRFDLNIVQGCLRALVTAGHVKEGPPQLYRRTTVSSQDEPMHKAKPAPGPANVVSLPMPDKLTERDPLESIGALAQRLRESGRQLIMWAEDLEQAGIEYETRIEAASKDSPEIAKLRQLQSILNSLR